MTTFDKREEAFERQFVHDEGVRFKALARRNKRLGLWAAADASGWWKLLIRTVRANDDD